ncbi:hypothetical protein NBRC116592_21880 [Colwellia sp. KU-HH00111]
MNYIKAYGLFIISYLTFTFTGVFINSFFNITPEVGLNIAALIITTLLVTRFKHIDFFKSYSRIIFSLFGGGVSVITTSILANIFSSFIEPNIVESLVIFVFNSVVIYLTIQISHKNS